MYIVFERLTSSCMRWECWRCLTWLHGLLGQILILPTRLGNYCGTWGLAGVAFHLGCWNSLGLLNGASLLDLVYILSISRPIETISQLTTGPRLKAIYTYITGMTRPPVDWRLTLVGLIAIEQLQWLRSAPIGKDNNTWYKCRFIPGVGPASCCMVISDN